MGTVSAPRARDLSHARQRRVSVAEYHRRIEAGILGEDEPVELLEGEIVEMSPQDEAHARPLHRLTRFFNRALSDAYVVRTQMPLTLRRSEPEPDLAIVRAADEAASETSPRTALLVVEVAHTTVRRDLEIKARIYASAGIPEYWLVVTRKRSIEVFRNPDPKAGVYRTRFLSGPADKLRPLKLKRVELAVRSLFE
jgi:Uma2 family endonuclease